MRFYIRQHEYYCGIDLHARSMYVCVLDREGAVQLHGNIKANPGAFLSAIGPYRQDLVVAVECILGFSPIHAVTNGTSDSQNSRCRLAHRIAPVTRWVQYSMW
jgi:hypothetical protein